MMKIKELGMKQSAIVAVFVLMLASICVPVIAQDSRINYQTYILETFDSPDASEWTWNGVGSKFVTDGYPVLKYFDGMPNAVRVMQTDDNPDKAHKYLGAQFKFNRQGDNWVDIFPVKNSEGASGQGMEPYEISFKGIISRVDLWVWGAGYSYDLEMLVRDCYGVVHVLPISTLNFHGWKNLAVSIPSHIQQASPYLSDVKHLKLVSLRIRTQPQEKVHDFYVFFDELKVLTNMHSETYDGYELVDATFNAETKEGGK